MKTQAGPPSLPSLSPLSTDWLAPPSAYASSCQIVPKLQVFTWALASLPARSSLLQVLWLSLLQQIISPSTSSPLHSASLAYKLKNLSFSSKSLAGLSLSWKSSSVLSKSEFCLSSLISPVAFLFSASCMLTALHYLRNAMRSSWPALCSL